MRNFISEDDIEQAILSKLKEEPLKYDILICDPSPDKRDVLPDGTGRNSKKECVLPDVMLSSLKRVNPTIGEDKIKEIVKTLRQDYTGTDIVDTNYKLYRQIRNNIKITVRRNGKEDFDFVKLIDFEHPENNTFTAVSQMWIQGKVYYRRPDILIFVNGMPLVFIELKNSIVKVEEAYNKNLKDYMRDIPNLFAFNQICVLSNGLETKLGAFNATYDYFFEWLKIDSEKEKLDREAILAADNVKDSSVRYFIDGLLNKDRLIDYIENFILFENQRIKIIAKNHQYLGVNNLMESVENRKELNGKLGVFWHTQGSGKSYSMVMFARKVKRKIAGNFSFLVITDREDLDTQIHKNFVRTEVIGSKEECQPKDSKQLRDFLTTNKAFIFTLIHKFRYDKTKKYPVLSTRDDIIVLVDEAHRTQYKDLAENMRTALPNANFVAFTGTPLLGTKRLTNQWFGDYVSEYNFAQSVEDGSTVPLFYSRRVPEVGLENDFLDDDVVDIIEEENLNEDETRLLENASSRILEVIKRDDRLDKVAQDIAYHFPRRGFLGKGMVVSVDKYTAVKMYDKVQHYWVIENDKFAPLVYLHGLFYHTIDDEKVARARQKMSQILDGSVTARQDFVNYVSEESTQYMIKGTKAIDLSKVDVEQLRKEIKVAKYKAIEINDLKEYIEQALEKMLNRNCTRTKFSERFKRIIDSYNAGGTENEDYYEQLVKLLEELRQEDNRANTEGLTEEELEIYDLLIAGKKLTQGEEQKVKLSAKNLYKKLVDNRSSLLVVDWYKDEQPRAKLKYEVELSLNDDLPESYDKAAFDSKVSLLMNHFVDMAVQGYGWIGAA